MAVTPLFIADTATLLAKLRLTGVKASSDCMRIVDDVILQVRLGFLDFLGQDRISAITGITYTDAPTDADGAMRLRANIAESSWVRLHLLRRLPLQFMDAGGKTRETWNDEGLTRDAANMEAEIKRLELEVQDLLADLTGEQDPDEGTLNVSVIGPDRRPPVPGETAFGRRRYRSGFFPTSYRNNGSHFG